MSSLRGKKTKCEQVKEVILDSILKGELKPGERVLPVGKLAAQLHTNPMMAHRALSRLVEEEFLESRGVRGFFVKSTATDAERAADSEKQPSSQKIVLYCQHHSDLYWKWPGKIYAQYRESQLNQMADAFRKNGKMSAASEQSEVMRQYLAEHPENKEIFQKAVQDGRFTLTGGALIPDVNMISGETLVRILQRGRQYYKETFGVDVNIACFSDAFGMHAQIPQVMKKSGYHYLCPGIRTPGLPDECRESRAFVWQALDGTAVTVGLAMQLDSVSRRTNLPLILTEEERLYDCLSSLRQSSMSRDALLCYTTEIEDIRYDLLFPILQRVNAEPGNNKIEFGSLKQFLENLDPEALPVFNGEINPIFTGCYTTRIGVKQQLRAGENQLFAAELLATLTQTKTDLSAAWENLTLNTFHDVICGCVHDDVMAEAQTRFDKARAETERNISKCAKKLPQLTVLNPSAIAGDRIVECDAEKASALADVTIQADGDRAFFQANLPACGIRSFRKGKAKLAKARKIGNRFTAGIFEVDFSTPHPSITTKYGTLAKDKFGEILFRLDCGSMWDDRFGSTYYGSDQMEEKVTAIEDGPLFVSVKTEGKVLPPQFRPWDGAVGTHWTGFGALSFCKTYRFFKSQNYFTMKVQLDWAGHNGKIFVRFPLDVDVCNARGLYHIPFGSAVRQPYFEVKKSFLSTLKELPRDVYQHASGDWPALNWVDYADLNRGCAIANNGTPGCQCVNGALQYSLLRSGTMILDGLMHPQPGALDNGTHEYEFAFAPHGAECEEAVRIASDALNRKPLLILGAAKASEAVKALPVFREDNIVISSIRTTEDGVVIRAYEAFGEETCATLALPAQARLAESDLQESSWEKLSGNQVAFKPYEIKTILLNKFVAQTK